MKVIYSDQKPSKAWSKSLFLAGPTPRSKEVPSWRPEALKILENLGYNGVVFVPEPSDGKWKRDYDAQVEWEDFALNAADCILFWIPRSEDLPALTTNIEWGVWCDSGKAVVGFPKKTPSTDYIQYYADKLKTPAKHSLQKTLEAAVELIGEGDYRRNGEREVPLYIWRTKHFQKWYQAQINAGHILNSAKVVWTFRVGPKRNIMFFWALHIKMEIYGEDRIKENEVVLSRPDLSTIVAFKPVSEVQRMLNTGNHPELDTKILIVREYRSPASTEDGFIRELPGGSSWNTADLPTAIAAEELKEETGLAITPDRFQTLASRQVCGTLSAHQADTYVCHLTEEEFEFLEGQAGTPHGVLEDTERTYVEVYTLRELLETNTVDWANMGMILQAIYLS